MHKCGFGQAKFDVSATVRNFRKTGSKTVSVVGFYLLHYADTQ